MAKKSSRRRRNRSAVERTGRRPTAPAPATAPILFAFLLSGFAGLMHQVIWAKLLVGIIGATAYAQATVLAVFMGGLAIGAVAIGRRIDRLGRPLRTYVILELAIAAYCLALPLFLALEAKSVLIIGHGSGITLGSALRHPLERVDVAEISSGVLGADEHFAEHNHHALSDPRVHVYREDGQSFLRTTPRRYDVIISEPSNPWIAGISALFTVEFFEVARDRLEPGGVFCMWFHTYHQNDEGVRLVLRTLDAVFPHAIVFVDDDEGNLIVLASDRRLQPDYAAMERRFERAEVRDDLARLSMANLMSFLTHHRFSEDAFRDLLGYGPRNTASRQRLEYAAPRSYFLGEHSYFVERRDPLILNRPPPTGLMIDGYLDWRSSVGRPVGTRELEEAARYTERRGGYGPKVARAVRSRATRRAGAAR